MRQKTIYLNNLINNGFVEVGKRDFLSKELHIHRGQWLVVTIIPPIRKLCGEENSKLNIRFYGYYNTIINVMII